MNKTETVLLCRYAKAMCPAQAIDEYTPDAWADVLHDATLEDAKQAIRDGIRDHGWRFIDLTDLVAGVRRVRNGRMVEWRSKFGELIPPRDYDDDIDGGVRWLMETGERIRAGEITHPSQIGMVDPKSLPVHDISSLGSIGQRVPRA